MTMQNILASAFPILFLISCSDVKPNVTDLPEKTIEVVVSDSDVITIDGKELHVSFFEEILEVLSNSHNLTVDIDILPDAITGVVFDVTHTVHRQSPMLASKTSMDKQ